ncbi:MAG: NUDIX domain-containing protein [Planctomycetota bacterium]
MSELHHRIKIFVYRFEDRTPNYLLLKPDQGLEALWGPLQGGLGFGEKLETAIRRRVEQDVGLQPPGAVTDLEMPGRWRIGDEEIIEWTFGVRARGKLDRDRVASTWADHRWARFQDAYQSLGLEPDRAAVMRLHTQVLAA